MFTIFKILTTSFFDILTWCYRRLTTDLLRLTDSVGPDFVQRKNARVNKTYEQNWRSICFGTLPKSNNSKYFTILFWITLYFYQNWSIYSWQNSAVVCFIYFTSIMQRKEKTTWKKKCSRLYILCKNLNSCDGESQLNICHF